MSEKLTFCREPGPGETRLCTDPWTFVYVRANGAVELCCRGVVVGNVRERPLDDILAGEAATKLRVGLLSGEPEPGCRACPRCAVTSLATLRRAVEHELFEAGVEELERLRREVREHGASRAELLAEREHLRGHAANLEAERPHLVGHIANLEAERPRLVEHIANLEAERVRLVERVAELERDRAAPPRRPAFARLPRWLSWLSWFGRLGRRPSA